jgi:hypothetical protein
MGKTPLTKEMRDGAVERMINQLAKPKADAAKMVAQNKIRELLVSICPPGILKIYGEFPEYFASVMDIAAVTIPHGEGADYERQLYRQVDASGIPVSNKCTYLNDWYRLREKIIEDFPRANISFAQDAVERFERAIEEMDTFEKTARRTLAQFRTVEALTEQWPDAATYIPIPEKRELPAVRCDDLIKLVREFESGVRHG